MKRKTISKSVRFEIFKRDSFTCRYCGAKPPDVILAVDHVQPVAAGGDDDQLNLVTSCDACNSGKSSKPLHDAIPRPDADLAYLEAQQEIGEVRRYLATKEQRAALEEQVIELLEECWMLHMPNWIGLKDGNLRRWYSQYSPEEIEYAIQRCASRAHGGKVDRYSVPNYIWGILKNHRQEAAE